MASTSPSNEILLASEEVLVISRGARLRVVRIGEHRDPRGFRNVLLVEILQVVLAGVDTLLDPLPPPVRPAVEHAHLRQATVRFEPRAHRNLLAPDVLDRLGAPNARAGHQHVHGERAIVLAILLVSPARILDGAPRP